MRNRIGILHGVNLDMLGKRDPEHYGELSLAELERRVDAYAHELDLETRFFQTNNEGEFVEHLHRLGGLADGALINAGAWSHYSYAIRDALEFSGLPAVEVHLSQVSQREIWRRHSVFDGLVLGVVEGKKERGYREALGMLRTALEEADQ